MNDLRRALIFPCAVLAMLVTFACSENAPGSGGTDGGGVPTMDATPGSTTVPTLTSVEDAVQTCDEACTNLGFSCRGDCVIEGGEGAGLASYGYFDTDFGLEIVVRSDTLDSCSASIPSEISADGSNYALTELECCCGMPKVTIVEGDIDAPQSCSDVCASAGHEGCGDFHDWQRGGTNGLATGGSMTEYFRESTGSSAYYVDTCASVASRTKTNGSVVTTLNSMDCACY